MIQMFKPVLITIFLATVTVPSVACDMCGCGAGSFFFGAQPFNTISYVGIRYRQSNYISWYDRLLKVQHSKEKFNTAELWGRWQLNKQFQLQAVLPLNHNIQWMDNKRKTLNGLGDASLLLNYSLLNTSKVNQSNKLIQHQWWVGAGTKLPTGSYQYSNDATDVANANFQLGTGSVDFFLSTSYQFRVQQWGMATDVTYKMNTANKNDYRFGNRLQANVNAFIVIKKASVGLVPSAGIGAEIAAKDKANAIDNAFTGGYVYRANLALDAYIGKFSIGAAIQQPIWQRTGTGALDAKLGGMVQIRYFLQQKFKTSIL